MKGKSLLLILLVSQTISAQLALTPGSRFAMSGNISMTLQNMDLINNGNFTVANNMIRFTGNNSNTISGSQPTQFFEIEVNKTNNSLLKLQRPINVIFRVLFTSGFLDLNGFDTDLGKGGHLDGEQENARVIGPNGGEVLFSVNLNSPTNSNPANLGVIITTSQNLGSVIVKRGHKSQSIPGVSKSVFRYYDISTANSANLNATLRFNYFNGELNGLDESQLGSYRTFDLINWSGLGFTSKDTVVNFVERTGVATFSRFTLSDNFSSPLSALFTLFNLRCDGDKVVIAWKTSQEQNSNHFTIEKSADGSQWTVMGNLPAAGNSNSERSYSYNDNSPAQDNFYRIAEYAMDGSVQYTGVLRSTCNLRDMFTVWPNPMHDKVFINIVSSNESAAMIKVFDSKGALVKVQRATVLRGSNQIRVDIGWLANGVYSLNAEWNNGQMKKTVQLFKQ